MRKKSTLIPFQLFFGLLPLVAIVTQLVRHIGSGANIVNFFSYFTNLSNIFAAGVLAVGAYRLFRNSKLSVHYELMRGASVMCMAVVGIVFSLLLRGGDLGALYPLVNIVLHYIMPVVVVVFWFVYPPQIKISPKQAAAWLTFPAVYTIYSLVRGAIIHWYAYPFFNPTKSGGYLGVAAYCVGILVLFMGFTAVTMWGANRNGVKA